MRIVWWCFAASEIDSLHRGGGPLGPAYSRRLSLRLSCLKDEGRRRLLLARVVVAFGGADCCLWLTKAVVDFG